MIDELDRVRRFRADEPPAEAAVLDAARARLMERIAAETVAPSQSVIRDRRGRRARRRRITVLLAAACGAAAVWMLVGTTGSSSVATGVADALERLAKVAAAQSPVKAPGPGQYLYVDSVQANQSDAPETGCSVLVPEHRQIWIAADGSGRLLETYGRGSYLSAAARAACARTPNALGSPGTSDVWFAAQCFDLGLPGRVTGNFNDPHLLLAELRRLDGGPRTAAEDFVHIGDALRESDASPALRAAIYRAAATIPGVKLLGTRIDQLGRPGVAIAFVSQGFADELIFDRHTSAFLGEDDISPRGQLVGWAAYRTNRIVNRIPGHAPTRLWPPCHNGGGYAHTRPGGVTVMTGAPAAG